MDTRVVAVVIAYNSSRHIGALLDSLPAAFGDVDHEVVVVDNGSSDDTVDVVAARGDARLVRSTNTGFAGGINTGVRHAAGRGPILVLNPDAEIGAGAVPAMLAVLAGPGVGVVAPRMVEADGSLSPSLRREPSLPRAGGLSFTGLPAFAERIEDPAEVADQHVVDWAVGAVMLISRDCFAALDGFDESYFLYSEETDFSLRARDQGWLTVYTPDAEVKHIGGGSGESSTTHTMKMVNRVRIYGRRHGRMATAAYFGIAVLTELRRAALGHHWSWDTLRALLRPSLRPAQLNAGDSLIPG
ncbi:MAG: glycosyltransferase family 2 protein [Propionicimonas sp.]